MSRDQTFVDQGSAARHKGVARADSPYAGTSRRGVLWTLGWDRRECQIAHAEHRVPNIPVAELPKVAAPAQSAPPSAPRAVPVKPVRQRMEWSQAQLQALRRGLRDEATGFELSKSLGIGLIEVFFKATELEADLPARHNAQPWSEFGDAEIARMRAAKYSARLIGFAIGRTKSGIHARFVARRQAAIRQQYLQRVAE